MLVAEVAADVTREADVVRDAQVTVDRFGAIDDRRRTHPLTVSAGECRFDRADDLIGFRLGHRPEPLNAAV